jgi:hypothetical protein
MTLALEILKYSGVVVVSWVPTLFMLYWTGNTRVMVRKTSIIIMYGGRRDDQKKKKPRKMTQAGSKQQPVEGEAQSGWITTWQGGGCQIRKRMTNQNGKRPIQSILSIFRTTRINCNYIKNLGIAYPHQRAHFT